MHRLLIPLLSTSLILASGCDSSSNDSSSDDTSPSWSCPEPNDACMDEDNYQQCLDVVATCEGEVLIMESCPLQFGCDD